MTRRLAAMVAAAGGSVRTGTEVLGLREAATGVVVSTRSAQGREEEFDVVVLCPGLKADRLARGVGGGAEPRIMPFRGECYGIRPARRHLVSGLVYPVPDPRYPFLGVHLTPGSTARSSSDPTPCSLWPARVTPGGRCRPRT